MNELKKEQIKSIIITSISAVLGLLFCIIPIKMLGFIEVLVCSVLLAGGLILIVMYCVMTSESKEAGLLYKGVLAVIISVVLMFFPQLIVIVMGAAVALFGVLYIKSSITDRKAGEKTWIISLIIGIVFAGLGLFVSIVYNTPVAKNIVMIIFGISLLLISVTSLVYSFVIHKDFAEIEKEIKEDESEESENKKMQKSVKNNKKSVKNENAEGFAEIDDDSESEISEDENSDEGFI